MTTKKRVHVRVGHEIDRKFLFRKQEVALSIRKIVITLIF